MGKSRAPFSREKRKGAKVKNTTAGGTVGTVVGAILGPIGALAGAFVGAYLGHKKNPDKS
jgi:hypothetical protein